MDSETQIPQYLTLEQIEEAPDVLEEDVDVPEWGGKVQVRGFTKDVEMALREEAKGPDGEHDRRKMELLFLVHGIVNPPLAESAITMLSKKSSAACNRVLRVLMRLNGQDEESRDKRERDFRPGSASEDGVSAHGDAPEADAEEFAKGAV